MRKIDIYDAISGIDEKFCTDSENFDDIAREFKSAKIRRIGKIVSFAACLAVSVIAGINIYDMNIFDKEDLIKPSYHEENNYAAEEYRGTTENKLTTAVSYTDKNIVSNVSKATSSDKITELFSANTNTAVKTDNAVTETDKPVTSVPYTAGISQNITAVTHIRTDVPETVHTTAPISNTTEISTAAVSNTDTSETAKSTGTDHNKPGIPDSTEVTDVTVNSGSETTVTTRSTAKTTKGTGVTMPTDTGVTAQKPIETTVTQQYYICDFENTCYQAANDTVDSSLIIGFLGEAYMNGYDPETDTHYNCKVRVYEIKNQPPYYMIAVHFEDKKEFFIYVNSG